MEQLKIIVQLGISLLRRITFFMSFLFPPVFKITLVNIFNILEAYLSPKMTAKYEPDITILIELLILLCARSI